MQEHQIAAHEQLYQDAIRRRLRQEEMAHWYPEEMTFQPTLETGAHQPDATKVMADSVLNVSDRSALCSESAPCSEPAVCAVNEPKTPNRRCRLVARWL